MIGFWCMSLCQILALITLFLVCLHFFLSTCAHKFSFGLHVLSKNTSIKIKCLICYIDPIKREQLNWEKLYKIIGGIAWGLLYLLEDSWLAIIHRDLKASNIILDEEMNPKISDFGMAKLFLLDQTQSNTSRIVGT